MFCPDANKRSLGNMDKINDEIVCRGASKNNPSVSGPRKRITEVQSRVLACFVGSIKVRDFF